MAKIGIKECISVPIRRNGLAGSGIENVCHANVENLIKYYGGKRVMGYIKSPDFDCSDVRSYISHSVWVTPEGNLADVTAHSYTKNAKFQQVFSTGIENGFSRCLVQFIAPKKDIKKIGIFADFRNYTDAVKEKKGYRSVYTNSSELLNIPFNEICLENLLMDFEPLSSIAMGGALKYGGFSNKTSVTNRTWDEIVSTYKTR